MKAFLFAACLVLATVTLAHASDPTESLPGIIDMTPENADSILNGKKLVLAEFYAPWCGHCKSMTPEFKKLGELINADAKLKSRVIVTKCNADSHRELGERYDVKGFPTIKFFPRGKPATKANAEDYNEARTADAFLAFLKKKLAEDKGFGRVDALAPIAAKFATAEDKAALIKEATDASAELTGDDKENAALYVKLMEKTVEKGDEYLTKEKARLEKMLGSGSVHATKVDEMSRKVSILGALLNADEE